MLLASLCVEGKQGTKPVNVHTNVVYSNLATRGGSDKTLTLLSSGDFRVQRLPLTQQSHSQTAG